MSSIDCNPGFALSASMEECVACTLGRYQPQSGQTSCIQCPEGTTTQNTGSTSSDQCGTYKANKKAKGLMASCQHGSIPSKLNPLKSY